jgi:hypothetical protein
MVFNDENRVVSDSAREARKLLMQLGAKQR